MSVLRDSDGAYLVAGRVEHKLDAHWPCYLITADGETRGPQPLGNWLRFVPSDYEEAGPPYPEAVMKAIRAFDADASPGTPWKPLKPVE